MENVRRAPNFQSTMWTRLQRWAAAVIIKALRLNGESRFSNEFIQLLDPRVTVSLPDDRRLIFRTGHGRLLWRAQASLDEEPLLREWIKSFSGADCFYDIGANVGMFALFAAQQGVRVFAFEPEINNIALLYENIFINNLQEKCTALPIALGERTAFDHLYIKAFSKGDALHGLGRPARYLDLEHERPMQVLTLGARVDDVVGQFGLPAPTKMKIDVDGNELLVLRGAVASLQKVREIYIELDEAFDEHLLAREFLEGMGFKLHASEAIKSNRVATAGNFLFKRYD